MQSVRLDVCTYHGLRDSGEMSEFGRCDRCLGVDLAVIRVIGRVCVDGGSVEGLVWAVLPREFLVVALAQPRFGRCAAGMPFRLRSNGVLLSDAVRPGPGPGTTPPVVEDQGRVERVGWAQQTLAALRSLNASQREVIRLSYFERLSQEDIASRLGLPVQMVRVTAASALQRIADALADNDGLPG